MYSYTCMCSLDVNHNFWSWENTDPKSILMPKPASIQVRVPEARNVDMRNGLHYKVSQAHGLGNPKEDFMKNEKLRNALKTLSFLDTEIENLLN